MLRARQRLILRGYAPSRSGLDGIHGGLRASGIRSLAGFWCGIIDSDEASDRPGASRVLAGRFAGAGGLNWLVVHEQLAMLVLHWVTPHVDLFLPVQDIRRPVKIRFRDSVADSHQIRLQGVGRVCARKALAPEQESTRGGRTVSCRGTERKRCSDDGLYVCRVYRSAKALLTPLALVSTARTPDLYAKCRDRARCSEHIKSDG